MGPVRTIPEAFQCEQAINRNVILQLDHPIAGQIRLPGSPIKYSTDSGEDASSVVTDPPPNAHISWKGEEELKMSPRVTLSVYPFP